MELIDVFCGIGGFSAAIVTVERRSSTSETPWTIRFGVDHDDAMVRLWAANTGGEGILANLWTDVVAWPPDHPTLHVHLSPPCTTRPRTTTPDEGLDHLRHLGSTSLNGTPVEPRDRLHTRRAALVEALGVAPPSSTRRLRHSAASASSPAPPLIHRLHDFVRRVSVREAMAAAGLSLPAEHVKNTSLTRTSACVRSVDGPAYLETASHPLVWCDGWHDGAVLERA